MSFFPLEIFPGPLAYSVITSVWIGVVVTGAFNTRLGWVLSGLVVNGYIVPLFIVNPWVAITVLVESLVAYLLAYFYSEVLSRKKVWASTFGRDRFFVIVLFSVLVRVFFGKVLLPILGDWISVFSDFDYANNLYSVGLVIIALTANAIWKPGVRGAIVPLSVQFLVTFVLIRYGLMEFTNFSISNLAFAYDDVSTFIDSSPKSYFILLTAAFMASKLNLRYGWDFNGILIPSLLALQWYQPQRILVTFVEAWLIYYFGRSVLKLKIFKQTNLEGAPKVIIFYSISYAYKYIVTLVCLYFQLELRVTDYYAYGYLVSTLLALKMHDKNAPFSLPRICLQTSAMAAFLGVSIGFGFSKVSNGLSLLTASSTEIEQAQVQKTSLKYTEKMLQLKVSLYNELYNPGSISREKIPRLVELVTTLYQKGYVEGSSSSRQILTELSNLGYKIELDQERSYLYLSPTRFGHQFGVFVFNLNTDSDLIVDVPKARKEFFSYDAGAYLFERLKARAFFAHQVEDYSLDGEANQYYARVKDLLFSSLFEENYLRVREKKGFLKDYRLPFKIETSNQGSFVLARHRLPKNLELNAINEIDEDVTMKWFEGTNLVQIEGEGEKKSIEIPTGYATLLLSHKASYDFSKVWLKSYEASSFQPDFKKHMKNLIQEQSPYIANYLTETYTPPDRGLLFLWDQEVFSEIFEYINATPQKPFKDWFKYMKLKLGWLGYDISFYGKEQEKILVLNRRLQKKEAVPNHLGVFVMRMNPKHGYIVESPRPFYRKYTNEYALSLFHALPADALFIAGAHPYANADRSSDQWSKENPVSLITMAHQVFLREYQGGALLPVQVRGYFHREDQSSGKPILLANLQGEWEEEHHDALQEHLLKTINGKKDIVDIVDGRLSTAGFENAETAQTPFSGQNYYRRYALVWLPPEVLKNYGPVVDPAAEIRKFTTYNVPAYYTDLEDYLKRYPFQSNYKKDISFERSLKKYLKTRDVAAVYQMLFESNLKDFHILREKVSNHLLLAVRRGGSTAAVVNLTSRTVDEVRVYSESSNLKTGISNLLGGESLWLQGEKR